MKSWLSAGAVALLMVLLAIPAAAPAKTRQYTVAGGHSMEFSLRGSNGFRIHISASAGGSQIVAYKRHAWVAYFPRRRSAFGERINAVLPGVGRISVEFQPRGATRRIPLFPGCEGQPGYKRRGVFVGTIQLNGERGFTRVYSDRARGESSRTFDEVCREQAGQQSESHISTLDASTRRGRTEIHFGATRFEPTDGAPLPEPGIVVFSATAFTMGPRVVVVRSVTSSPDKDRGFSILDPGKLDTALVDPAGPFGGSASYGLNPDGSASWTGTLSTEIPGMDTVSLAGPRFKARLCIDKRCSGDEPSSGQQKATLMSVGRWR